MISTITDFFGGIWAKIAAGALIVLAILGAVLKLISIGKKSAEAEGQRAQLDNVATRNKVDITVGNASDDDVRNELRANWTKPQ